MCTAVAFGKNNRYFGRNLDYEVTFGENVVVTPRNYGIKLRYMPDMKRHAAFIGTAAIMDGYPLYYEATNEYGLSMAGLNFVGNCTYCETSLDMRVNLCQFEMIPYILGRCRTLSDARTVFERINLVGERFLPKLALPELHWMLADSSGCAVLEISDSGTTVYDNAFSVLTNNPPFPFHSNNLCMYRALSTDDRVNGFGGGLGLDSFSRVMGAIGLPGDWSSPSRFVRAAFVRANAREGGDEVQQLFHILASVEMVDGCVAVEDGFEYTQYSCCCDTQSGIYYFKMYGDSYIRSVDMKKYDLDGKELVCIEHKNVPMAQLKNNDKLI